MSRPAWIYSSSLRLKRLTSRRDEAIGVVGLEKVEQYERYLAALVREFEHGHANLYRLTFQRVDGR